MKKKIIIGSFAVLAIVALAAYNVYFNNEKEQLSALALANIQALASGEDLTGGEIWGHTICYYKSKVVIGYTYYDCQTCRQVMDEKPKGSPSKCY